MLPVEVEFDFSEQGTAFSGGGQVWLGGNPDVKFYQCRLHVGDPGGVLFDAFQKAVEHAVVSGNQFAHLTIRRDRQRDSSKPFNGIADLKEVQAEHAGLRELMQSADAKTAHLPPIEFNGISFEDALQLRAPLWGQSWFESYGVPSSFIDPRIAKWREAWENWQKRRQASP